MDLDLLVEFFEADGLIENIDSTLKSTSTFYEQLFAQRSRKHKKD